MDAGDLERVETFRGADPGASVSAVVDEAMVGTHSDKSVSAEDQVKVRIPFQAATQIAICYGCGGQGSPVF